MKQKIDLCLDRLKSGYPALTKPLGMTHAESASVCLDEMGHELVAELAVEGSDYEYQVTRLPVTDDMKRAYADIVNATNIGACGVAIMLAKAELGYVAIRQAKRGTGFDYWCSNESDPDVLPFQNAARLEVSGILRATDSQFKSRAKVKLAQPAPSDDTKLPVVAVVVDFGKPRAKVAQR